MDKIQIYSIIGSSLFLLFIFRLIRRRELKEEYSLLWLFVASIFLILSVFRSGLEWFADLVGIHYAPAALLLILLVGVVAILIHYSKIISKLSEQNKILIQEIALLKLKISEQKNGRENE
ncbi:MAG: DUF2304 domain-containing protein [Fibromonadaceae bacterium]|jgi:hypothetical protein|nr:DUF2304 domain-containing protein [Fibromonadaceae bacterium]